MANGSNNNLNHFYYPNSSAISNNSRGDTAIYGDDEVKCIEIISVYYVVTYADVSMVSVPHQSM